MRLLVVKGGQGGEAVLSTSKPLHNLETSPTGEPRGEGKAQEGGQVSELSPDDVYEIEERASIEHEAGVNPKALKCPYDRWRDRARYIKWHKARGLPIPADDDKDDDDDKDGDK